jgi:hypothetical protein
MKALSDVRYEYVGVRTVNFNNVPTKMFAFTRKGVSTRNLELYDNVLYTHRDGRRDHFLTNSQGEIEITHN